VSFLFREAFVNDNRKAFTIAEDMYELIEGGVTCIALAKFLPKR